MKADMGVMLHKLMELFKTTLNNFMPITDNNGSQFYNVNFNRSFNQTIGSTLTCLSAWLASEVTVINRTGSVIYLYDNNVFGDAFNMQLSANESVTLRGIANSNQVSARADTPGPLYFRASRFSNYGQG